MASILALSFLGVTFLAHYYHIVPRADETVVSMLTRELFGRGWIYYMIQAATAVILLLAVNTSFAGFPMLASIMAKDRFLPGSSRAWVTAWSSATEFSSWPGSPACSS